MCFIPEMQGWFILGNLLTSYAIVMSIHALMKFQHSLIITTQENRGHGDEKHLYSSVLKPVSYSMGRL